MRGGVFLYRDSKYAANPTRLHQCIGLVFGLRKEVKRIERYHAEPVKVEMNYPLWAECSLFCSHCAIYLIAVCARQYCANSLFDKKFELREAAMSERNPIARAAAAMPACQGA